MPQILCHYLCATNNGTTFIELSKDAVTLSPPKNRRAKLVHIRYAAGQLLGSAAAVNVFPELRSSSPTCARKARKNLVNRKFTARV